ncbi:MAG: DMT family transporter [Acidobacteriota bacterium]
MRAFRPFTILLWIFPLVWAGSFIAGKWAIRDFPPEVVAFLRFTIASAALLPFAFRRPSAPGAWAPRRLLVLFLLGLTGIFGYHVLFYYSLKYTTAGNSSLIIATDSLMTVLLAVAFLKERMTWRKGLGIALGFAGVVWIVSDGALRVLLSRGPNLGDLLAFGAALAWAAYSVLSKPVAHLYASLDLSWITWAVGALLLSPSLLADGAVSSLASASLLGWACVLYMALAATGLGYFVYLKGIKEIGAAATAKYIFLVPVYVLVLAFFFLGEPVPLHKVLAAAVILGGIWLAEEPRRAEADEP